MVRDNLSGRETTVRLATVLVLAGGFVLLWLLLQWSWEPLEMMDRQVSRAAQQATGSQPVFSAVMQLVTEAGRPLTWWIVHPVAAAYLLVRRRIREALFVAVTAASGGILNRVFKALAARDRPEWSEPLVEATGFAFPSGHSLGTFIGVSVLLIVFAPAMSVRWRWVIISLGAVFIVAVGSSRVMLGVHWPSDVLGAWLFSAAWVVMMTMFFRPGSRLPVKNRQ